MQDHSGGTPERKFIASRWESRGSAAVVANRKPTIQPPAIQFINTTGHVLKDPEVGRIVRSHVMRKFRYQTRKFDGKGTPGTRTTAKQSGYEDAVAALEQYVNVSIHQLSRTTLDAYKLDQFNCLPVTTTPEINLLLDYCQLLFQCKLLQPC
jgi:hypothetical protein